MKTIPTAPKKLLRLSVLGNIPVPNKTGAALPPHRTQPSCQGLLRAKASRDTDGWLLLGKKKESVQFRGHAVKRFESQKKQYSVTSRPHHPSHWALAQSPMSPDLTHASQAPASPPRWSATLLIKPCMLPSNVSGAAARGRLYGIVWRFCDKCLGDGMEKLLVTSLFHGSRLTSHNLKRGTVWSTQLPSGDNHRFPYPTVCQFA